MKHLIILVALLSVQVLPVCNQQMNGKTFKVVSKSDAQTLVTEPQTFSHMPQCNEAKTEHRDLIICEAGIWKTVDCK